MAAPLESTTTPLTELETVCPKAREEMKNSKKNVNRLIKSLLITIDFAKDARNTKSTILPSEFLSFSPDADMLNISLRQTPQAVKDFSALPLISFENRGGAEPSVSLAALEPLLQER
jgi:hypothetical protein